MLYLASTSPRRKELLTQIGVSFQTLKIDVDETPLVDESPSSYVARLSLSKAQAGLVQCSQQDMVIAADTTVVFNNMIIGKPSNEKDALDIWQSLSGQKHQVLTGVTVANQHTQKTIVVTTDVYFRQLTIEEMTAYWLTGEPKDKAGGYGIQGKGVLFVEKIEGSYSNVVGLPLTELALLLREFGLKI